MEKQRYFFDMDGTLAVFRKLSTFEDLLQPGYFRKLPPMDRVIRAVKLLMQRENVEVFILSSYLTESNTALKEKNLWLDKYLPEIDQNHRIFVPCGQCKKDYVPNPSPKDRLVDDYGLNLNAWHGLAIKIYNGINGTSGRVWSGPSVHYLDHPSKIVNDLLNAPYFTRRIDIQTTSQETNDEKRRNTFHI